MEDTISRSPEETFALGEGIAAELASGDVVLLYGGLGAGKTLLAKGILNALDFDVDEVTSPSFTLVNLYKAPRFDVYHIDLWRLDGQTDTAAAVGLDEILEKENAVTIIEWADRLENTALSARSLKIHIEGDGSQPRRISIQSNEGERVAEAG
jgi:tRNA threonylcarbamoyladenosine biosynthesis protein TsaE